MNARDSIYSALDAATPHVQRDHVEELLERTVRDTPPFKGCLYDPGAIGSNSRDRYEAAFREVMGGAPQFFDCARPDFWDAEQYLSMLDAVGRALRMPGHTAESVGVAVLAAVAQIAHNYADGQP